ncbi:MAG: hypothetical protein IPH58_10615 [Sphingobacteriales bacterium]|nr:hypothetical protein [Sphingobacteriales bacterium]
MKSLLKNLSWGLLIATCMFNFSALAQPVSQTYTTPGVYTYVIPEGYTATIKVDAWGAGGGGGGDEWARKGSGGGGGAYAGKTLTLPAGNYKVVVGKGGLGAYRPETPVGSGIKQIDGESSTFGEGWVIANGGIAGGDRNADGGAGGAASTDGSGMSGAFNSFKGGDGGNTHALSTYGSGGGGSAWANAAGENGKNPSASDGGKGGAGTAYGGEGGSVGDRAGNGYKPGGGGGGKYSGHRESGNGGDGQVTITVLSSSLPVAFEDINASISGNTLNINFKTLEETNTSHFNIQGSIDGVKFVNIGKIESKHKGSVHSGTTSYSLNVGITNIALGVSLLALLGLGFAADRKRRMLMSAIVLILFIGTMAVSCSKKGNELKSDKNLPDFVRVEQVYMDGSCTYSKIIKVVRE